MHGTRVEQHIKQLSSRKTEAVNCSLAAIESKMLVYCAHQSLHAATPTFYCNHSNLQVFQLIASYLLASRHVL